MSDDSRSRAKSSRIRRWLSIFGTVIVCLVILAGAAGAIVVINRTEPTAKQINMTRKSAALVETIHVERGTYRPKLVVLGTVQPARDIVLGSRVQGQVTEMSPTFVPGGMVEKGELLLRIDPADFENELSIRSSELEQKKASLEIEEGRQSLAKKELKLLEATIDDTNRALVLRAPQIASIRAEVSAAEAAVERAKLNLDRATIRAPFDAQILTQSVNVGSQVSSGDELAQLVGVREYWIMAAVPVRSLRWVQFPDSETEGSKVTLRNPDAWPPGVERHASVSRMIGTVDERTRLARVMITVEDPLGKLSDSPPLILGSLIETEIEGRVIDNVVRLNRDYIRDQDTVWVMKDGTLQIRDVTVEFRDSDYGYISEGLDSDDEVVITTLATVADGVSLRRIEKDDTGGEDATEEVAE